MIFQIAPYVSVLCVFLLQGQAFAREQSPVPNVSKVASSSSIKLESKVPVNIQIELAQSSIRAGDPVVIQFTFLNNSQTNTYCFLLPDDGQEWLTLRLRDKSGKEVGTSSVVDFAGSRTFAAVMARGWQRLLWTRLYLKPGGYGDGKVFSDEIMSSSVSSGDLVPGSYTLTAELSLPCIADPLGRKRSNLAAGFPYEAKLEYLRGRHLIDTVTGTRAYISSPEAVVLPSASGTITQIRKTFTLPLEVVNDTRSLHREILELESRIVAAYPPVTKPREMSSYDPATLPVLEPGTTRVVAPYAMQNRQRIAGSRVDIKSLFSLSSPDAHRAQLYVARTIFETGRSGYSTNLGIFYNNVALVGTPAVADFLADQAWVRNREEALTPLASMLDYGSVPVRRKVEAYFAQHHARIPQVYRDSD